MDKARRSDDLIGRIAAEIEAPQGPDDLQRQGPDVDVRQEPVELGVVQVQLDAPELDEPGKLPENDGRDAPAGGTQNSALARRDMTRHRVDQDVGVKIEHAT